MNTLFTSLRRYPFQNLAIFLILATCLFLFALTLFSSVYLSGFLNYVEGKPQVTLFFNPKTTEEQITSIKQTLEASQKVSAIRYIDKNDALNIYTKDIGNDPILIDIVRTADILPPSLEVFAKEPRFLDEIAAYANTEKTIEKVQFQKDIVDRLFSITKSVRIGSIIFLGFITFVTMVILTLITSYKVAYKREEIRLMLLLGAEIGFVKRPFFKESVFLAGLSTMFVSSILLCSGLYLFKKYQEQLNNLPQLYIQLPYIGSVTIWPLTYSSVSVFFVLLLVFSLFLSIIATNLGVGKYVKTRS